jgi:hypothetical protein
VYVILVQIAESDRRIHREGRVVAAAGQDVLEKDTVYTVGRRLFCGGSAIVVLMDYAGHSSGLHHAPGGK